MDEIETYLGPISNNMKRRKTQSGRALSKRIRREMAAGMYPNVTVLTPRAKGLNRRGVSSETGFVDLPLANYAMDTTGTIALVATVAQGASVNQRVGKKILWKSIQVRGDFQANTTATSNDVTMLLIYDRRPTGALPAITDILVTANSQAFNNDANSGRFKILRRVDRTIIGNSTTPATGMEAFSVDDYISLKGLPGVFKAAGSGAIGDIEEGALYLVTVGNRVAGNTAVTGVLAFRTRFLDV